MTTLDLNNEIDLAAFNEMFGKTKAGTLSGLNFILAMRNADGTITLYNRYNQPCYGEMRRYWSTHGDLCTQPLSDKPLDLHHPFPDGVVVGYATHWHHLFGGYYSEQAGPSIASSNRFIDYCLSDASPWVSGFGGFNNVELVSRDDGRIIGLVLKDTRVDPTVLVNLLSFINMWVLLGTEYWETLIEGGMSEYEALVTIMLTSSNPFKVNRPSWVYPAYGYYFPAYADMARIMERRPNHDLTRGTWYDGFDYNRRDLHAIYARLETPRRLSFKCHVMDTKNSTKFSDEVNEKMGINPNIRDTYKVITPDIFIPAAKEVIKEGIERSKKADEIAGLEFVEVSEVPRDERGRFARKIA